MKRGRWSSPGSHLLISFECPTVYSPSFLMVMRTSILAVFFERHSRWIRSDVLSIRRAEKEWMAGRLPVQSLRVSTSSLACFCHKLLFGRGLICPSSPCSELCRPSSNLQHQTRDACTNSTLPQVRATQDTGGGCGFFFLFFLCVWALSVLTKRHSENRHVKRGLISVSQPRLPRRRVLTR